MKRITLNSTEDLTSVVSDFVATLEPKNDITCVIGLSGDLGVGKTTFVQYLAKYLSIDEPITSPTFTLMKRYATDSEKFKTLLHMDAYRIESESELEPLRFNELLTLDKTIFCIEWAERIKDALPPDAIHLELAINEENKHTIQRVQ